MQISRQMLIDNFGNTLHGWDQIFCHAFKNFFELDETIALINYISEDNTDLFWFIVVYEEWQGHFEELFTEPNLIFKRVVATDKQQILNSLKFQSCIIITAFSFEKETQKWYYFLVFEFVGLGKI